MPSVAFSAATPVSFQTCVSPPEREALARGGHSGAASRGAPRCSPYAYSPCSGPGRCERVGSGQAPGPGGAGGTRGPAPHPQGAPETKRPELVTARRSLRPRTGCWHRGH